MSAKARYQQLAEIRQPFLDRARECSALTLPYLVPPEGLSKGAKLPTPWQAVGGRGVTALGSKLITTLMPPNESFFRLSLEDYILQKLGAQPGAKTQIEEALGMIERTVSSAVESSNIRVGLFELALHLLVSGNALIYLDENLNIRVYGLDHFVAVRDGAGNVLELIAHESIAYVALPAEVQEALSSAALDKKENVQTEYDLYTHLKRSDPKTMSVSQWVNDIEVTTSRGFYKDEVSPWMAIRWHRVDREDYGRGHTETYLGDFKTLEGLRKALVDYAAAAAKAVPLVNPNGITRAADLSKAENFEFTPGRVEDVQFLQVNKMGDLQVSLRLTEELTRSLSMAFLLGSAVQRSGERVTAEEIRFMAEELEATIGGVYAILAQELQLPLARILMHRLAQKGRIPVLPKDLVSPQITTGLDALTRAADISKLHRIMDSVQRYYGPAAVDRETNLSVFINRSSVALGVSTTDLVKSEEQKAAEAERAMQMQMMQSLGPQAVSQMGQIAQKGMEP